MFPTAEAVTPSAIKTKENPNENKVVLYKTEGNFKTDLDLYGSADCLGVFKKINNAADLDLTCEFVDQYNNNMWATLLRKTEDIDAVIEILSKILE